MTRQTYNYNSIKFKFTSPCEASLVLFNLTNNYAYNPFHISEIYWNFIFVQFMNIFVCYFSTQPFSVQLEINETVKSLSCPKEYSVKESESTFLLVMQTKAQKELINKYGNNVTLMDGIYRTTKYGFPCIFLTVKTSIGYGMVVATIIPQYESETMLAEGLAIVKQWNPLWSPKFTMTDKSSVELNAIGKVFPAAIRLLCDFHRSQAWERWVSKNANNINSHDRSDVLLQLKKLAYAPESTLSANSKE